ncbi:MAG TPA: DUF4124 domain-containing protein [Steroidobacteraceae bacterium]|nr:DUF4124 domain-containing protein [Steroidobacteraceae bacterium]
MRKILTLATAVLIASSALASGDIYRWKDANGTWHYSDQQQPGAELVHRASGALPPPAPAPASVPSTPPPAADNSAPPVSDEVAAQVRQEAAAAKSEQCKKADETYQAAVRARIVKKPDGSAMSDAEIDTYRLQARSARDLACGPGA